METTTTENGNVLTKAERFYEDLMSWKGITYIIVGMYIFMAAVNIRKHLKR